jgi:hypothetical protein
MNHLVANYGQTLTTCDGFIALAFNFGGQFPFKQLILQFDNFMLATNRVLVNRNTFFLHKFLIILLHFANHFVTVSLLIVLLICWPALSMAILFYKCVKLLENILIWLRQSAHSFIPHPQPAFIVYKVIIVFSAWQRLFYFNRLYILNFAQQIYRIV